MENNQSEKTGKFICEMRKRQNMTQKELAEKLEVTDKAISKWERGLSCPDISLLIPLAKILGVTTGELLNGEKNTEILERPAEDAVEEALQYSDRSLKLKFDNIRKLILVCLSASFLVGAFICVICDFCIYGTLSWSLIVMASLVFCWFLLAPFFVYKSKRIKKSLIVLSAGIILYLALLAWILKLPVILYMGAWISIVSMIGLWCTYIAFCKLWSRKLMASGIFFLIAIPVTVGINHIIIQFVRQPEPVFAQDIISTLSLLIVAVICFAVDYFFSRKDRKKL